ncbi:MAG: hypothetical protein GY861_21335 [bacterium]|nr:hypothetical protein [bacterium]
MNGVLLIRIARLGDAIKEVAVEHGSTIEQAANAVGIASLEGMKVKLNGTDATPSTPLVREGTVVLVPNIRGGNGDVVICKVAKLGGTVNQVAMAQGSMVRDALSAAGISDAGSGFKIKVNDVDASLDTKLTSDASIVLIPRIRGGNGDVVVMRVAKLGGTVSEVAVATGSRVRDALSAAGISEAGSGFKIKVNDSDASLDTVLSSDGSIVLIPRIRGGNGDVVVAKVAKLGGTVSEVAVATGSLVRNALTAAGISDAGSGFKIKVNDVDASMDTALTSDCSIVLIPRIRGGRG